MQACWCLRPQAPPTMHCHADLWLYLLIPTHLQIRRVCGDLGTASFLVVQDDLLHPVLGGNKCRKLDGLMPSLVQEGVTHVVRWMLFLLTGCLQRSAQLAPGFTTKIQQAMEPGLEELLLAAGS